MVLSHVLTEQIKSKNIVQKKDFKGLLAFEEDYPDVKKIIIINEGRHFIEESNIEVIPLFEFLKMLWSHEFKFE